MYFCDSCCVINVSAVKFQDVGKTAEICKLHHTVSKEFSVLHTAWIIVSSRFLDCWCLFIWTITLHHYSDHPHIPSNAQNLYKIMHDPCTWTLLHVSVINRDSQGDNSKEYKMKRSISHIQCLKNYGSYRHKDVDVIDVVMLTDSWIMIVTVPGIYICEILLYEKIYLSRFKTNSIFHSYDTRNKSDAFITGHNTKLYEQRITYNGVLLYKSLSNEIKSIICIMKFKLIIINFLLEKFLFCGRIDCWSLICKDCVNDGFYIVTICTLYLNDAYD